MRRFTENTTSGSREMQHIKKKLKNTSSWRKHIKHIKKKSMKITNNNKKMTTNMF